ncbi:Right handed beta helix region [Pedobacter nyackensis]|uniref:Right handed beta helix region n=2 Tax=Pedobacter nyackensis TaxID=475255 RepID=A0A1W2D3E1_9SPHI|nr:Right handed beta helix region [Pedobacter nyackensis]
MPFLMMQQSYGQTENRWKKLREIAKTPYPDSSIRVPSVGHTTYFVNPVTGNDQNKGTKASVAWKSFANVNALRLAPGDKIVIAPGIHEYTLMPFGKGTLKQPVVIEFLPGKHQFTSPKSLRRVWHISNTADFTFTPKPCGILMEGAKHVIIRGGGINGRGKTIIMMSGPERMAKVINHLSEDIFYEHLVFDLKRPSVSEIMVLNASADAATVQVAEASTYKIESGKFKWTGDLGYGWIMAQEADLKTRKSKRLDKWSPFDAATATDLGKGKVRLNYPKKDCRLQKGKSYGFRYILHDLLSFHNTHSKNISFYDCEINAMTNMSFVSQFTENLSFRGVNVVPPKNTNRVSPSSMDVFHFANCRGQILIDSCRISGAGDDGVNYHGINVGIAGKPAENKLQLRFMQQQTYGFAPCVPGDEIAVINHLTLCEIKDNPHRKVTAVEVMPGDTTRKNWIVTLDGPAPMFNKDDVVDNLSWHADVTIRNNLIELASCRGILATSRGKIIIEGNSINSLMPGVLIEDDANKWWESGPVRDLLIQNNTFLNCGIDIAPQIVKLGGSVHENIRILGNKFVGQAKTNPTASRGVINCPFITVRGVKGLKISGNKFPAEVSVFTEDCEAVIIENNLINQK